MNSLRVLQERTEARACAAEQTLVDTALVVRDLQTAIHEAIEAIERKSYETARRRLKQALDEMPMWQRRREREL
jgi:RNA polymerase-interacting CarD/CdnL/TRCF family regulator